MAEQVKPLRFHDHRHLLEPARTLSDAELWNKRVAVASGYPQTRSNKRWRRDASGNLQQYRKD